MEKDPIFEQNWNHLNRMMWDKIFIKFFSKYFPSTHDFIHDFPNQSSIYSYHVFHIKETEPKIGIFLGQKFKAGTS